ncbi:MAG: hypothetical protein ACE5JX_11755 [Acidobacteriota bacterium]
MRLAEIPDVCLEESGVTLKYLVLRVASNGEEKILVRGLNYRPYDPGLEKRIVERTFDELDEAGFDEENDILEVGGGGALSRNPYDQTISLFGADPVYQQEADREATAKLVERAFPDHEVSWALPEGDASPSASSKEKEKQKR